MQEFSDCRWFDNLASECGYNRPAIVDANSKKYQHRQQLQFNLKSNNCSSNNRIKITNSNSQPACFSECLYACVWVCAFVIGKQANRKALPISLFFRHHSQQSIRGSSEAVKSAGQVELWPTGKKNNTAPSCRDRVLVLEPGWECCCASCTTQVHWKIKSDCSQKQNMYNINNQVWGNIRAECGSRELASTTQEEVDTSGVRELEEEEKNRVCCLHVARCSFK